MTAAITEHDVTVYQGDVREQLALLPAASVQCIVTSPPYYGLRDYGVDGQIGLEPSPAEYVAEMVAVFREARRVLADDGVLWLNIGDSYSSPVMHNDNAHNANRNGSSDAKARAMGAAMGRVKRPMVLPAKNLLGIPWRVAFGLQDDGWTLRNDVIWHKPNAMPESVTDRLSTRYEHVFLFSKSRRYWFDLDPIREAYSPIKSAERARVGNVVDATRYAPGDRNDAARHTTAGMAMVEHPAGRNPGDVWMVPTSPFAGAHFATMPPALAERCILAGCPTGGTVLDPFAGSGTTLMTARKLDRKSIGIELNPTYIDIIRQRIGQTPFQFDEVTA
jgi:site-specific DNA-methyltransferase (cytosine-N4-specific)